MSRCTAIRMLESGGGSASNFGILIPALTMGSNYIITCRINKNYCIQQSSKATLLITPKLKYIYLKQNLDINIFLNVSKKRKNSKSNNNKKTKNLLAESGTDSLNISAEVCREGCFGDTWASAELLTVSLCDKGFSF